MSESSPTEGKRNVNHDNAWGESPELIDRGEEGSDEDTEDPGDDVGTV
jgi:hypothetical protein